VIVQLTGQAGDVFGEVFGHFGEAGVLLQQFKQLRGVLRGLGLALGIGLCQRFTVLRIGIGLRLVAGGLTGLCQQNQRRGVGRLQAESEVQQDERVNVEGGHAKHVQADPQQHNQSLRAEKHRRTEEPRKRLGAQGEGVVAEGGAEVGVGAVEAQVIDGDCFRCCGFFSGHDALGRAWGV
jgi:hypothetical protein